MTTRKGVIADLMLVLICLFWGMSFIMVKTAITELDLYWFLFLRFSLATAILLAVLCRTAQKVYLSHSFRDGFILGSVLFSAFVLQTIGLNYTSASNAGFITGLHVILVPFILAIFFRKMPAATATIGAVISAAGLFLLTVGDDFSINRGDVWVIVMRGERGLPRDPDGVVRGQARRIPRGDSPDGGDDDVGGGVGRNDRRGAPRLSGIRDRRHHVPGDLRDRLQLHRPDLGAAVHVPHRAAVIFTMEPVFAAIFAYWWGGEVLGSRGYVGAALILTGIILSEFRAKQWRQEESGRHHATH